MQLYVRGLHRMTGDGRLMPGKPGDSPDRCVHGIGIMQACAFCESEADGVCREENGQSLIDQVAQVREWWKTKMWEFQWPWRTLWF